MPNFNILACFEGAILGVPKIVNRYLENIFSKIDEPNSLKIDIE